MSSASDFTDSRYSLAELAFQGAEEMNVERTCRPETIDVLAAWHDRANQRESGAEMFRFEHCPAFTMTYEGSAGDYWPNEKENDLVETLVRDFLYRDGICSFKDDRVRLFHLKYTIMAVAGDEYVLVCPYLTDTGNISGIVVVCVTKVVQ